MTTYSAHNDGEWFWIAEDPTSGGKEYKDALEDHMDTLEDAISELEHVVYTTYQHWKDDPAPHAVKVQMPF